MRTRGFTLMELLIVIGIIMVLMGLLFPAIHLIKRQAQKAKARTLLSQVMAACDLYRNHNGAVPDSAAMKTVFMPATAPRAADNVTPAEWTTVAGELLSRLAKTDRDTFGGMTELKDPWGGTLRYRPVQYYPYTVGAPLEVDQDPAPRPDSYQLWSTGPDATDDSGKDGSDDIVVWRK